MSSFFTMIALPIWKRILTVNISSSKAHEMIRKPQLIVHIVGLDSSARSTKYVEPTFTRHRR